MGAAPRYFGRRHPLRNDAAVADHDDRVGVEASQLRTEFFVVLDAVRLGDREIQLARRLFDRRSDELETASFGAIWLGYDELHSVARRDELFQRGDSEARCAAEDERQRH